MKPDDALSLFDRPIAFHPGFVKLTGSVNAALMLSQAFYWSKRTRPSAEGWFYKSQDDWTKEVYLTRREQETARKLLRATGFWQESRRGNPAKMYYRLDLDVFQSVISGDSCVQTRMAESAIHESTEEPIKNGVNSHTPRARPSDLTETTTETTTTSPLTPQGGKVKRPSAPPMTDEEKAAEALVDELFAYRLAIVGTIRFPAADKKEINWILQHGYDPEQAKQCYAYLRTDAFLRNVTWRTVAERIGDWVAKGSPLTYIAPNGNTTHETASERDYRNISQALHRVQRGGDEDNYQDPALLLTTGLK